MFDRKAYNRNYYTNQRKQRKAEGRCVACGAKLTEKDTTLQCEFCRQKQKYANCKKENITQLIAEAKADTVRKMQERFIAEIEQTPNANEHFIKAWKSKIDQIAKEMVEGE